MSLLFFSFYVLFTISLKSSIRFVIRRPKLNKIQEVSTRERKREGYFLVGFRSTAQSVPEERQARVKALPSARKKVDRNPDTRNFREPISSIPRPFLTLYRKQVNINDAASRIYLISRISTSKFSSSIRNFWILLCYLLVYYLDFVEIRFLRVYISLKK